MVLAALHCTYIDNDSLHHNQLHEETNNKP